MIALSRAYVFGNAIAALKSSVEEGGIFIDSMTSGDSEGRWVVMRGSRKGKFYRAYVYDENTGAIYEVVDLGSINMTDEQMISHVLMKNEFAS